MIALLAASFVLGALVSGALVSVGFIDGGASLLSPAVVASMLTLCVLLVYLAQDFSAKSWVLIPSIAAFIAGLALVVPASTEVPPGLARVDLRILRETAHGSFARIESGERIGASTNNNGTEDLNLPAAVLFVSDLHAPLRSKVRAMVRVARPHGFRNISPHSEWRGTRIDAFASLQGEPRIDASFGAEILFAARGAIRGALTSTLSPGAAGLARALTLGEGSAVSIQDRNAFRDAGLAHLLAVSGLHVGIVVMLAMLVLRFFVRRFTKSAIDPLGRACLYCLPLTLVFALLSGGAPSVWRAALMTAAALLLRFLRRRPSKSALLGIAIIVFSLVSPEQVRRPAFLLSIAATMAILTGSFHGSSLVVAFRISWRTTVATAPLVLWFFDGLPLWGVIANVIVLPIAAGLLVPLCFVHLLLSSLGLAFLSAPLVELASLVSLAGGKLFASSVLLPPMSNLQGVFLVLFVSALLLTRGRTLLVFTSILFALFGAEELRLRHDEQPEELRVSFVDVGQGDAALVDLPNGQLVVVDVAGGRTRAGAQAVLPLLRARRRNHIDLLVISHPHPDHFAGVPALLDAGITVGQAWVSGQAIEETPFNPASLLARRLRRSGTDVRLPAELCRNSEQGDGAEGTHYFGESRIEVLHPCPSFDPGYGPNENSLVIRLEHGERSVLFTGDAEGHAESALLSRNLQAEILKVGHHGSRTSSSEAFLRAVAPGVAVASNGRFNMFGHPHADVVERFSAHRVPLLNTSEYGGVEARGRRFGWIIESSTGMRLLIGTGKRRFAHDEASTQFHSRATLLGKVGNAFGVQKNSRFEAGDRGM